MPHQRWVGRAAERCLDATSSVGVCWCVLVCVGVCWCVLVFVLVCVGVCVGVCVSVCACVLVCVGVCVGVCWCVLVCIGVSVLLFVVVLPLPRIIKSVVTGEAPVTLELRNTLGKKHKQPKVVHAYITSDAIHASTRNISDIPVPGTWYFADTARRKESTLQHGGTARHGRASHRSARRRTALRGTAEL